MPKLDTVPPAIREEAEHIMERLDLLIAMVDPPRSKGLSEAGTIWSQAKLYVRRGLWAIEREGEP